MITNVQQAYTPLINFSKKFSHDLLTPAELKLSSLKNDTFIKSKLSAPLCAGSFFIRPSFADSLKQLSKKEIYKLKPILDTQNKTVSIEKKPLLTNLLNNFMHKVPEIYFIFRPKTNEPDLAQHVISTLREVLVHPRYNDLSSREQNILNICALTHDIGKAIISSPDHAEASSRIISKRLDKINMPIKDKKLIVKLIEHHHYCYNVKYNNKSCSEYSKIFDENEFKLIQILTEADLRSKKLNLKNISRRLENTLIFRAQVNEYKKLNKTA